MGVRRSGFTLIEIVVVILIGSILTSLAMAGFGNMRGAYAVRGAKQTFQSLHARTRAQAIESGQTVKLVVSAVGDTAYITRNDSVLEAIDFGGELHVDLRGADARFVVCFGPQGYGDSSCSTYSNIATLQFWQNADSTSIRILPLGQLVS